MAIILGRKPGGAGGGSGGSPTGPAGGVLSGTYPDPGFAVDMATQAELVAAAGSTVVKTTTESVASSTALQADDELFFPVADGHTYWFYMVVVFDEPANSGTPDFKWAMDDSNGGSIVGNWLHSGTSTANSGQVAVLVDDGVTASNLADQNQRAVVVQGVCFRESGGDANFGLWWAQNTSSANAVRVLAGSTLQWKALT